MVEFKQFAPRPDRIVWADTETGGLDHTTTPLFEIAVVITDGSFNTLYETELVFRTSSADLSLMSPGAFNMHKNSGLYDDLLDAVDNDAYPDYDDVDKKMVEALIEHEALGAALGGNNVGFDRNMIDRFLPEFARKIHYRNIDVSTLKELAQLHRPDLLNFSESKSLTHRAKSDIYESIGELKHYIDSGFLRINL